MLVDEKTAKWFFEIRNMAERYRASCFLVPDIFVDYSLPYTVEELKSSRTSTKHRCHFDKELIDAFSSCEISDEGKVNNFYVLLDFLNEKKKIEEILEIGKVLGLKMTNPRDQLEFNFNYIQGNFELDTRRFSESFYVCATTEIFYRETNQILHSFIDHRKKLVSFDIEPTFSSVVTSDVLWLFKK